MASATTTTLTTTSSASVSSVAATTSFRFSPRLVLWTLFLLVSAVILNFSLVTDTKIGSIGNIVRRNSGVIDNDDANALFTTHIDELLFWYNQTQSQYDPHNKCSGSVEILVTSPYSVPSVVECSNSVHNEIFCAFIRAFLDVHPTKIFPYNISIGISMGDMIQSTQYGQCLGSSAHDGTFSMNNFQDIQQHLKAILRDMENGSSNSNLQCDTTTNSSVNCHDNQQQHQPQPYYQRTTGYNYDLYMPWEERYKIPIFRGHPRDNEKRFLPNPNETCLHVSPKDLGLRSQLAFWSLDHPELLDAMVAYRSETNTHPCFIHGATNGFDKLYRRNGYEYNATTDRRQPPSIPKTEFYTHYQTVVVMGGIGAAFRTASHLSTGQAVILHNHTYHEWYYKYLTPYVNYIPLDRDLANLEQVTTFVRDHPDKVKAIAEAGKQFYEDYLNFVKNEEHWYELLWRYSLERHAFEETQQLQQHGTEEDRWQGVDYTRYVRDPSTGRFEVSTTSTATTAI